MSLSSEVFQQGPIGPGRLAQLACVLEVMAPKPGNVHRLADLPGLRLVNFLASALAIGEPLDRAAAIGIGAAVEQAIAATRRLVATNTNLGMVLLLAPLAAVPATRDLREAVNAVLDATNVNDARAVYRAIRLAQPGGLGAVTDQDVRDEPTLPLRAVMAMAADRDLVARQYANGFREVFDDGLPALAESLRLGRSVETSIVAAHLTLLSRYPDSLIARKTGPEAASRSRAAPARSWPPAGPTTLRRSGCARNSTHGFATPPVVTTPAPPPTLSPHASSPDSATA